MSDIGEGIGSAVTGGLFARVLEPNTGARERGPHDPDNCLNCGTALVGAYCHACGQSGHIHSSIGAFMHDLLHGALHFEGKMWRTLPMLVLRPGRLTRRYIEGARARFVSPMALFLFAVFLMFAAFQVMGITMNTDLTPNIPSREEFAEAQQAAQEQAEAARVAYEALGPDDATREAMRDRMEDAEATAEAVMSAEQFASIGSVPIASYESGVPWFDKLVGKWKANPGLMLYKLQANAYKFSWMLIPLSLPFVWLLFAWKRRFNAYDHAIFVTYSLSFMTLLFIAASVLGKLGVVTGWLLAAVGVIAPLHVYKQLRGAYQLSRFSTLWRLLFLFVFIVVILLIFLQILLAFGAF